MKMKIKNNITFFAICFIFLAMLSSCNRNVVYNEYQEIDNYVWTQNKSLEFCCNIEDTSCPYNIFLNIRHANFFPYKNIWLTVKIIKPNLTSNIVDTVECILAEDNGRWIGDGLGDIWDYKHQWIIQDNKIFTEPGNYYFVVNHLMRSDTISGIMDIGLEVEKFEYNN